MILCCATREHNGGTQCAPPHPLRKHVMLEVATADLLDKVFGPAGFDGVWSKQSRSLFASDRFKDQEVTLDRNWVITPQNFVCCVCGRNKVQLLTEGDGVLTAILHCDHDHICDVIHARAKELRICEDIRPLVKSYSSYEPVIVCKACNWLDSQVKRMLPKVHKYFSFPPSEKRLLIKEFGKKRHKIDKNLALHKWRCHAKGFMAKLAAVDRDLQDFLDSDRKFIGYNPKKKLFHGAFQRFSATDSPEIFGLSFHEFLRFSMGISRKS